MIKPSFYIMYKLLLKLWVLVLFIEPQKSALGATIDLISDSACYGVFDQSNSIHMSCHAERIIVVRDVFAVSKPRASKCPQQQTENDIDISCCQYDKNDCSIAYKGEYRDSYYNCTGKSSCNKRVSWTDSSPYCDTTIYMERTNYMMINYYCIPVGLNSAAEYSIVDPCSSARIIAREVFLYASRQSKFQCNCVIEPMCKMEFKIDVLVFSGLSQEEIICKQINVSSPKNSYASNGCNRTNGYLPVSLFEGFQDILSLKLINDDEVPGGSFLIQIEGLSRTGQIKISCQKSSAFSRMRSTAISEECDIEDTTTSVTTPTKKRFIKVKNCESTHNLHCKDPFCLPEWNLDSFFFICPDLAQIISQGYCGVFSLLAEKVTFREESLCTTFTATCPNKPYEASDIKNYPTCTKVDTVHRCYLDDPKCRELGHSLDETYSKETSTQVATTNGSAMLSARKIWLFVLHLVLILLYTSLKKLEDIK